MYLCLQGAEDDIVTAVATVGPVSIAFDVALGFQFYRKGVYTGLIKVISINCYCLYSASFLFRLFCRKSPQHVNHAGMYIYMCVCVCVCVCMYVCEYVRMNEPMYVCMCVCIYVYLCVYVHMYKPMYVHVCMLATSGLAKHFNFVLKAWFTTCTGAASIVSIKGKSIFH